MKRTIFTIFFMGCLTISFAQSVTIEPNTIQLPQVSANPTCASSEKGKMIYNTVTNKVLYCNGTNWVSNQVEGETSVIPAFQVNSFLSKILTSNESEVEMSSKIYDLTNSVTLKNDEDFPNRFTVPTNGIYSIKVYGDLELTSYTPKSTTRVYLSIVREGNFGTYHYSSGFPIYANDNWKHLLAAKDFNLVAGERILVKVHVFDPPATGTLRIHKVYFEGHLIAKQ
ncbi:hypothetical protein [Emticicia agri]|uniref:C1q domain-containing protein n=1 Tax=Emticicia agri TaxID=2492393 RepID=A0A4Q5M4A1_9BACT|nr:hypothetical protein [Emticicia agri]RYU97005.1 hypothetical protein EWM59_03595 [Emticicia agri]